MLVYLLVVVEFEDATLQQVDNCLDVAAVQLLLLAGGEAAVY